MCFYQTPGHPTPHITDRVVSTVTLGWVGDLNQRIIGFVDRYLPRILINVGST